MPMEQDSAPFYCQQIMDLCEQRDGDNLFCRTGCLGYIEELSEKVLLQVLYEGLCEYGNLECCYFPPCDALLVMFCHEEGLHEMYWSEKLPTPVSFREFYDNVLHEETEWLVEQDRKYHESIKQSLLENQEKPAEKEFDSSPPCDTLPVEGHEPEPSSLTEKEEYILEGTLKHEDIVKSKTVKEPLKAEDKGKNEKKDTKKSSAKSKKSGKQQETEAEPSPVSPEAKPPAAQPKPSIRSNAEGIPSSGSFREKKLSHKPSLAKRGQKSNTGSKDEESTGLLQEEKHQGNIPQVYDIGPHGGRFSGKSVNFVSPNGETTISIDSREMPQGEKVLTLKIQQGKDHLYYSLELPPKAHGDEPLKGSAKESIVADPSRGRTLNETTSFHIVSEATGAVVAFCYQTYNPTHKGTEINKRSSERLERTRLSTASKRHSSSRQSSTGKLSRESKSKVRKPSESLTKDNLSPTPDKEEKSSILTNTPGFTMKLSLPSGLTIENKWALGPLGPFYIKQSYLSTGKNAGRPGEVFRLYLQNGNILKLKENGPLTIFHPSGRICNLNSRRTDSGDGPDEDREYVEPTGRRYREVPGGGDFVVDLPKYWVRQATDLENNEVFWCREDGVQSLLRADGSLTVIFPDGTCIVSKLKEEEDADDFVLVSLDFEMEHPLYAGVTLHGQSATLSMGHEDIYLTVSPDGTYRMATAEQVNTVVTTSFAKMSKGHSESTLFFNIPGQRAPRYESEGGEHSNGKEKSLCMTDDGWGNILTVGVDGCTTLSKTGDIKGVNDGELPGNKRFLVMMRNRSGSEFVPCSVIWDVLQESKLHKDVSVIRYPCDGCIDQNCPQNSHFLCIFQPVSNKERYFLESDIKCSTVLGKDHKILKKSTYWYPEPEGSGRKQVPRWFHPLPKSDFERSGYPKIEEKAPPMFACKFCHPESHEESRHLPLPDAFSLLLVRQLGSLGKEKGDIQMTDKLTSACLQHQESSKETDLLSHTYCEEIKEPTSCEYLSNKFKGSETEISVTSWLGFLDEGAWCNGGSEMYFSGLVEKVNSSVLVEEDNENSTSSK